MENEKVKNILRYRWDILLIACLLVLALLALTVVTLNKKEGALVHVEINGVTVASYPLSKNGTFVLNGGTNTLIIENGTARLVESHCPDRTCEKKGKIRYVGQTVVCLPNRLSVTVVGDAQNGVDLVS